MVLPTPAAPTLTAGPVVLRAPRAGDAQGVWEQCQDPLSQHWTTVPVPYTHADAQQFVDEIIPAGWADGSAWCFVVEAEGRFAGTIALRPASGRRAEVAYGSHPWVRGRGHLTTAVRLLLDWGFAERDLETVSWLANRGNWASRKLAWRLGFTFAGTLRRWMDHRDEHPDGWIATLHRDDPREPQGRWLTAPVLDADGVRLRPLGPGDVPRVVEACADDVTRHWLSRLPESTVENALLWYESVTDQQARGDGTTWAVADPATDLLLGTVGLFDVGPDDAELTYWLHPDARGRGVAVRAARAATSWAFADLGVEQVYAHAGVENLASRRVLTGAGFREGGVIRRGTRTRSGPADAVFHDVLVSEWPAPPPVGGAG